MDKMDRVSRLIASKSNVLLTSHIRLDGDAVASELALAEGLRRLGKQAHVVNDGVVPQIYRFLPGAEQVGDSPAALRGDYDLIIVVDSADVARTGDIQRALPMGVPILNIDHHASNDHFGDEVWVNLEASSVGEMIYGLLKHMGVTITNDIAVNIYVAIATDTGRFLHSNTTPKAMRIVADLLEAGVDLAAVNNVLYRSMTCGLFRLSAMAAQQTALFADGRIACMRLTRQMFEETGTSPLDTQEFVEIPRSLKGVLVAVLLSELEKPSRTKASFRSNTDVNVCAIAKQFGGGGHPRAAGCEIEAPIEEAQDRVVEAIEAALCHSCHPTPT